MKTSNLAVALIALLQGSGCIAAAGESVSADPPASAVADTGPDMAMSDGGLLDTNVDVSPLDGGSATDTATATASDSGLPVDSGSEDAGGSFDTGTADIGIGVVDTGTTDAGAGPDARVATPLGKVTVKVTPCDPKKSATDLVDAKCEVVTVSDCAGLAPMDVTLVSGEPSKGVALIGSIVFNSGSSGQTLYERAGKPALDALENLRKKGYRVIERSWEGTAKSAGWFEGSGGPANASCRFATLSQWLKTKRYPEKVAFCGTGNSGGSVELALAISRQDADATFDAVLLTSGPSAHFEDACAGDLDATWKKDCQSLLKPYRWECGAVAAPVCTFANGIKELIDGSYGHTNVCRDPLNAENVAKLTRDSTLAPTGKSDFPNTTVSFLFGAQDCDNGVVPTGLAYATAITTRGKAATIKVLPGVGHSIHEFVTGGENIEATLTATCKK